jgi:hypothetical protein
MYLSTVDTNSGILVHLSVVRVVAIVVNSAWQSFASRESVMTLGKTRSVENDDVLRVRVLIYPYHIQTPSNPE